MRRSLFALAGLISAGSALSNSALADDVARQDSAALSADGREGGHKPGRKLTVQLGPRPFYLVDDMDEGPLKNRLLSCSEHKFEPSDFSIGHRGAPLQFPEHSKESYLAGARMGAGIMECDVTFTKDKQLVCRHSQCDLHTTTNILTIPELAAKCRKPFTPYDAATNTPASAECCTSDITLAEYKALCAKMDAALPSATTPEAYQGGTSSFRTDLYATCATPVTLAESIQLSSSLGMKFTPELKEPLVPMPYDGDFTQEKYAQKMIDAYKAAGIAPSKVWAQSFNVNDVLYWIAREPAFGKQAVYLDDRPDTAEGNAAAIAGMSELARQGVRIVAPPAFALLALDAQKNIVASEYARAAKKAGLNIITWSLERSGPLATGGGYYFSTVAEVIDNDGDEYKVIDALARKVGVIGIFSDWPSVVTYYANCMGLK